MRSVAPGAVGVASRYAEGLFAAASAQGDVEGVRRELEQLVALVEQTPDLRALLSRPDLAAEQKMGVLEAALGREVSAKLMGLLAALVRHGRGGYLEAVAEAFGQLADRATGVVRARVRAAVPLTEEQRERLRAALSRLAGARVELEEEVDSSLLAGMVVEIGNRLIDGSAAGRLAQLRRTLLGLEG